MGFFDMEEMKQIDGFPDYFITPSGRVFSKRNKRFNGVFKELKLIKQGNGYWHVTLCNDVIQKQIGVHVLIARYFINNPHHKPEVNHINSDRGDYRLQNLEWVTHSENIKKAHERGDYKHGRYMKGKFGKDCHKSKKLVAKKIEDGSEQIFYGTAEAARELNLKQASISNVCTGYRKTLRGFKFFYI